MPPRANGGGRWRWRWLVALCLICTLSVWGWHSLTRGVLGRGLVISVLRTATGCAAAARQVHVHPFGALEVEGLALSVPEGAGVRGPAAQVLRAERVRVDLDWSGWMRGDVRPRAITLDRPVIRVSQDAEGRLKGAARGGAPLPGRGGVSAGGADRALPGLTANAARLEVGEHDGERYTVLAEINVGVSFTQDVARPGEHLVRLREIVPSTMPEESAIVFEGWINPRLGEGRGTLSGVTLDHWTAERVPASLRQAWRDFNMRGRILPTEFTYTLAGGIEATVRLGDVSMSIPGLGEHDVFGGSRPMVMQGVSGAVRFSYGGQQRPEGGIEATLAGRVEDLPCRVVFSTDGLDPRWAGMSCQVTTDDFLIERNPRLMPFMPELVRQRFASFSGPTATVRANATIRRAALPPVYANDMPRPLRVAGSVTFENGRAAFEHFPYPFFDLRGIVTFDDEAVEIKGISGRGLTGATLIGKGRISVPDNGAYAAIEVTVIDAPMDDLLWAAIDRRRELAAAVLKNVDDAKARLLRSPEGAGLRGPKLLEHLIGEEEFRRLRDGEHSWREGLFNTLFSARQHQRLVEDGLILTPAQAQMGRGEVERLLGAREALLSAGPPAAEVRAQDDALLAGIAQARSDLERPEFGFLGRVKQLTVKVDYSPSTHGHYDTDITMMFDGRGAGLVPDVFPLPMYAKELKIVVTDPAARFYAEVGRGLRAGVASIEGSVDLTSPERSAWTPTLRIEAKDFLVDDLLVNAIPRRGLTARAAQVGREKGISAKEVLDALRVRGLVDCTAKIEPDATGLAAMDIDVTLNGLLARPVPLRDDRPGMVVSGLEGHVRVSNDEVRLEGLRGQVRSANDPVILEIATPGFVGPPAIDTEMVERALDRPGSVSLDASVRTDDAGVRVRGRLSASRLDLAWPLEDAVAIVAGDAGLKLAELREARQPAGVFDAEVAAQRDADGRLRVGVGVKEASGLAVNALGGRLAVERESGDVRVELVSGGGRAADEGVAERLDAVVAFDDFRALVRMEGEDAASVGLDGSVRLTNLTGVKAEHGGDTGDGLSLSGPLRAAVRHGRFESAITKRVLNAAGLRGLTGTMESLSLRGVFDADVAAEPRMGGAAGEGGEGGQQELLLSTSIRPLSLGLTQVTETEGVRRERAADFERVAGRIVIDDRVGRIEGLAVAKDGWSADVDGTLAFGGSAADARGNGPPWSLDALVSVRGVGLDASLLALLPAPVAEAVEATGIRVREGFELDKGRLRVSGPLPGDGPSGGLRSVGSVSFQGRVGFSGLEAETGIALTGGTGDVAVDARLASGADRARVRMEFDVPVVEAAGLPLTAARAVVLTGTEEYDVLADTIEGECEGGRLSARAFVRRPEAGRSGAAPREYEASVRLDGVLVADLLGELERRALRTESAELVGPLPEEGQTGPSERVVEAMRVARERAAAESASGGDNSRGRLDAELAMQGLLGVPMSKTGGGTVRVAGGGDVLQSKALTQLVEFSNLRLPVGDALDFGQGRFELAGDRVSFEQFALVSENVSLIGYGQMTLPDLRLDFTFNSRGKDHVPILSDVYKAARDELITTRITGTLRKPNIGTEPFVGTRRMLDGLFGGGAGQVAPDAEAVDRQVREERARWQRSRSSD